MTPKVVFRSRAEDDIRKIHEWYESQQKGLGHDFLARLREKLETIQEHPSMFPIVYKSVRRAILSKFPYLLFYISRPDRIVVLAVLHAFRNPSNWPSR